MSKNRCIFCEFSGDLKAQVWENRNFFAMFCSFPVSPGHILIIPKRHIIGVIDMNRDEWSDLGEAVRGAIELIESINLKVFYEKMLDNPISDISEWFLRKAINHPLINAKPDAYNHGINDGRAAGRTVGHLHWHIIPRFNGDVDNPTGGVRNVIPEMGNYKIPRN